MMDESMVLFFWVKKWCGRTFENRCPLWISALYLASIDRYDLFEVEEEVGFLARKIFDPFGVHDVDSKESDLTWLIRPLRGPQRWLRRSRILPDRYDLFEVEEEVGFLTRMIFDPFGVHDFDSKESDLTWPIRPLRGRRKGVSFLARMIFDPFGVDDDDPERVIPYPRDTTSSGSTTMTLKGSYPTNLRGRPLWPWKGHILFSFTIRLPSTDPSGVEYSHFKSTIDFLTFPHCNSYRFSLNS